MESIFAKNSARNHEKKKNNTWNIRSLVNETIVPSTQHIILKIVGFQEYTVVAQARKWQHEKNIYFNFFGFITYQ